MKCRNWILANPECCLSSSSQAKGTLAVNESEKKTQNERAAARRSCEPPHSDGSMRFFRTQQLWELAEGLPIKKVRLKELDGFDEVHWFGGGML